MKYWVIIRCYYVHCICQFPQQLRDCWNLGLLSFSCSSLCSDLAQCRPKANKCVLTSPSRLWALSTNENRHLVPDAESLLLELTHHPYAACRKALSQSPLTSEEHEAFWRGSVRADCSSSLIVSMLCLSVPRCLCAGGRLAVLMKLRNSLTIMSCTSQWVCRHDDTGSPRGFRLGCRDTLLTSRPPSLTGKLKTFLFRQSHPSVLF